MRLTRLTVRRMPGIVDAFTIADVGPGLNLIVGPNGIGKSSAMTALRALLWPSKFQPAILDGDATWIDGDDTWRASQHTRGQTTWQRNGVDVEAPLLPDVRFASCFFPTLHSLLTPSKSDDDLGKEILNQLAGGYDVPALLASGRFGPLGRPGLTEAKETVEANQAVLQLNRGQADLAAQEAKLGDARRRLEDARSARARLDALERAKQRLDALDALGRAERELTDFPPGMERLRGDEGKRFAKLEENALDDLRKETLARADVVTHEREQDDCKLQTVVDVALLGTVRADADQARTLEQRLDDLVRRLAAAREKRTQAQLRVGSGPVAPRTDLASLAAIERLVHAGVDLAADSARLEAELGVTREGGPTDDAALREAAAALRAWLAAPAAVSASSLVRLVALTLAVLLLLVTVVLVVIVHVAWVTLAMVAVALGVAALLLDTQASDPRPGHVKRYLVTGVSPPAAWVVSHVEARLAQIDAEIAVVAAARVRADRRAGLEAAAEALRARNEAHQADLARARTTLGVEAGGTLTLATLADAMRQLTAAETEVTGLEAEHTEVSRQHDERLARLTAALTPFGYSVAHAEAAGASASALERRSQALLRATEQRLEAARRADDARSRALARRNEASELLLAAGATDLASLLARLDRLPSWTAAVTARHAAQGAVREHERALSGHADVLPLDATTLARETERAQREAAEADPLIESITRTVTEVGIARAGSTLEAALARRTAATQVLAERREQALATTAGRFLLQAVASRHEAEARPQVLQRAMDSFAAFTHHAWTLALGGDGAFRAVETASGDGRSLSEISDGTRAQLLLAVRLAFAKQAERGTRMPFVLDEALSVSDPTRFEAVVESLAALVGAEERQIFYLTSQPVDAERWRLRAGGVGDAMRLIDLGEIRRAQGAAPPEALRVIEMADVPPPGDDDASTYATRLSVPRLTLAGGDSALHPYYLLFDDIGALHAVLRMRVTTVGALKDLLASEAARALDEPLRRRLAERMRWLASFADAWKEGRGKPIGRHELVEAGVSPNFLEPLTILAGTLGGDPAALIGAMRSGKVPRLRGKTTDDLEAWLLARGFIDARPVLSADHLRVHVLAAAAEPGQHGAEIVAMVERWMGWAGG